jgi:ferredoxin
VLTSESVKSAAREFGADLVGIGNIERWAGAPLQQDPRQIMPEARSVVVLGFRIMRGSLRGVEEGTFFSSYASFGYGGITHLYMPIVIINMARYIEDHGKEAIPVGQIDHWRAIDNFGDPFFNHSRPVAPGKPRPDVSVHTRIAAYLAGLGEIGYSKVMLTPQYGPRQRFGIIITEAELEPDPIYSGPPLCNGCKACVRECPGCAISGQRTVKVTLAGKQVEWGELDVEACDVAFRGGRAPDPAKPDEMTVPYAKLWFDSKLPITRASHTPFTRKPGNIFETGEAVCGGRGCVRACMMSLEARGVLSNKFDRPFRRRPQWSVDWSDQPTKPPSYERNAGGDGGDVVS